MPKARNSTPKARNNATAKPPALRPKPPADRNANGRFANGNSGKGFSAPATLDLARARKTLNLMTIEAMIDAFRRGGRKAIDKVMVNAPAQFLKMAVLLVPRELEVTSSGGVRAMSDEQLERGIEALEALLAKRAAGPGADAKVIEGTVDQGDADIPSETKP